jgi:hypothetical protein
LSRTCGVISIMTSSREVMGFFSGASGQLRAK